MLLSAKLIKQPQRETPYYCATCNQPVSEWVIRLYGAAHTEEKPRHLYYHPQCLVVGETETDETRKLKLVLEKYYEDHVFQIAKPLIDLALECDGLTRVLSQKMQDAKIPHKVFTGMVTMTWTKNKGEAISPQVIPWHYWILLNGKILDYRLGMWFVGNPPSGLFYPDDFGLTYKGQETQLERLPDNVLNFMTSDAYSDIKAGKSGCVGNVYLVVNKLTGEYELKPIDVGALTGECELKPIDCIDVGALSE